jgi:hypothetical protein
MHRKFVFLMSAMVTLLAGACGSDGGGDIPNIAGNYLCTSGCSGTCVFDTEVSITQDGENFIIEGTSSNGLGTINSDGAFDFSLETGNCEGQFVGGTAIASCDLDGENCQQVTYKRQ